MTITIEKRNGHEKTIARVVAQLIREGVNFEVEDSENYWYIKFSGGY